MKCEYCDNELPSSAVQACPFCGSSLASNEYSLDEKEQVDDDIIDVMCPHCQSVYSISPSEWGEFRECEVCHESFPLAYGTLTDAQTNIIWKARIAGVVDKMRHGEDALFSAQSSMGDILLKPGEVLYERVEGVVLSEIRGVRRMVSERSSNRDYNYDSDIFGNRIRRTGEQYSYGGYSETATDYEYKDLDNGRLYLTSRRLLFIGNQMQRYVNLERITSFVPDLSRNGEIRIAEESKQKILRFSSESDNRIFFRFSLALKALRDASFKRFLQTATTDEIVAQFMKLSYFDELIPEPMQLTQPTQEQPERIIVGVRHLIGSLLFVISGIVLIFVGDTKEKLIGVLNVLFFGIAFVFCCRHIQQNE